MHALITGASSGIGEGIARAFAAAGYDITLVARRAAELERVAASLGNAIRVTRIPYDLADLEGIPDLIAKAETALGPIDVLVNNAGIQACVHTMETPPAEQERMITLNVFAPLRLTHAAFPAMRARGQGTIVDIASVAAFNHATYMTYYSASKAALAAASVSLRAELKEYGIHVLTVYPGPVHTPMGVNGVAAYDTDPTKGLMRLPWGTTDALANLVLNAVRGRQDEIVYPGFYWSGRWFRGISQRIMDKMTPKARRT
ncbi:MAG: SDR family NAD(P)-dependent oxidoreductase [Candidatus Sericytochromatia bacterium]|nr:SDR family NAD(P)-dependent oxidoreductase [Candidatus Sericytochromatia bacterium]